MKFFTAIALIMLNSMVLAATNAMEVVCSPTTNSAPVKVSKKVTKPVRPQCEATTLSGARCKRHATEGSKYCSQHAAILRKREKEAEVKRP